MYCIRLICKKVIETDEGPVFDEYVNATHVKIKDGTLYLLNPVISNAEEDGGFLLDEFSHIIVNHYQIYTLDELQKAYNKIINAYSTLSQSASYLKDYDSVISIFELVETMYSEKIDVITRSLIEQMTKFSSEKTSINNNKKEEVDVEEFNVKEDNKNGNNT